MATIVADIVYKATEKGMDAVKKKLDGIDKSSKKSGKSVSGLSMAMKAAIPLAVIAAGAKLVGVLSDMGREAARTGDAIVKTSQKLGISTTQLQEYQFAAEEAGIKQSTLEMGFQRFTRRLGEAQMGTGELKKGLEALNISVTDNEGNIRSNTDVFEEYMQKLSEVDDASLKLALTTKAFDSEGAVFVNMAGNLEKSKQKMREMGIIVDESILQRLAKVNNNLGVMNKQQDVLATEIGSAFTGVTETIEEWKVAILEAVRDVLKMIGLLDESEAELFANVARYEAERKNLVAQRIAMEKAGLADQAASYQKQIDAFDAGHKEEIDRYEEIKKSREEAYGTKTGKDGTSKDILGNVDVKASVDQNIQLISGMYDKLALMLIDSKTDEMLQMDMAHAYQLAKYDEQLVAFKGTKEQEMEFALLHAETRKLMVDKQVEEHRAAEERMIADTVAAEEKKEQARRGTLSTTEKWMEDTVDMNVRMEEIGITAAENMSQSFADFAVNGEKSFSEFAASFLKQIAQMIIQALALRAIQGAMGGITSLFAADGAAFAGPTKFASGGAFTNKVYNQPTKFAFGGGFGMMAEENPEAVMPLSRGSDGKLGVKASGASSGGNSVEIGNINIKVDGNNNQSGAEQGQAISRELVNAINVMIDGRVQEQRRVGNTLNPVAQVI